jgi:SAM-dependent methyltransferase
VEQAALADNQFDLIFTPSIVCPESADVYRIQPAIRGHAPYHRARDLQGEQLVKLNWAERWAVNNPLRVLMQKLEIGWMKRNATIRPAAHVLEIGCGRGAGAGLIRESFGPAVIYATDLDMEMLRRADAYLSIRLKTNISFSLVNAEQLPFGNGTLDAVFGFGVLHHVHDWNCALQEIARVLKDDGIYFLEELYPPLYQNCITRHILLHPRLNRFYSDDLKSALSNAGLTVKRKLELPHLGILSI